MVSDTPLAWRKSRRSTGESGNCVEAAPATEAVAVRDSKNPGGGQLRVSARGWESFARAVKAGKL